MTDDDDIAKDKEGFIDGHLGVTHDDDIAKDGRGLLPTILDTPKDTKVSNALASIFFLLCKISIIAFTFYQ